MHPQINGRNWTHYHCKIHENLDVTWLFDVYCTKYMCTWLSHRLWDSYCVNYFTALNQKFARQNWIPFLGTNFRYLADKILVWDSIQFGPGLHTKELIFASKRFPIVNEHINLFYWGKKPPPVFVTYKVLSVGKTFFYSSWKK